MKDNFIIKILTSLITILITLYFIPFLGVCLILLRCIFINSTKKSITFLLLSLFGLIIFIPKLLLSIFDIIKFDNNIIKMFNSFVNSDFYNVELVDYGKLLIVIGVLFYIISYVLNMIFEKIKAKASSKIMESIEKHEKRNYEIAKENDMKVRQMKENAKNTSYVKCPKCGSDNLVTGKHAICKYCRGILENKKYN